MGSVTLDLNLETAVTPRHNVGVSAWLVGGTHAVVVLQSEVSLRGTGKRRSPQAGTRRCRPAGAVSELRTVCSRWAQPCGEGPGSEDQQARCSFNLVSFQ